VKVEFTKVLNVTTKYPALGLFVIGLTFTTIALWFAKNEQAALLEITGNIADKPSDATVSVGTDFVSRALGSDGSIDEPFRPEIQRIIVQIHAPGWSEWQKSFPLQGLHSKVDLNPIQMTRVYDGKLNRHDEDVSPKPAGWVPLDQGGKY
jgi:hypothetical protein